MSIKNEFYIHIKNKPKWIKGVSFDKQSRDVQQFYLWELKKVREGITVGGIKFHPWLYWHINHWHMFQDVEQEDGSTVRINEKPLLRDNEYFINENILRAEENPKKGIMMFGTRRFAKSAVISSWTTWNSQVKYGGEASPNTIIGGNQEDLNSITSYIDHGLEYLHPMFKINRITRDWGGKQGVIFGKKLKNNETEIYSRISVLNLNMGGTSSTQKTAGQTPVSWVCDEIGKFDFKKSWETAKPSFDTGLGSWRISPWLVGTSGEIEMVKDAMSIVNNPEIHNLLTMDWSLIERNNPNPTWTRKNWGIFVPGQMSLAVKKVDSNLSEHLGIEDENLKKIEIKVTPWEEANKQLLDELNKVKKKDVTAYYNRRMFYPLDTDDCFLQDGFNPFPSSEALMHKNYLLETGDYGKAVDLGRNPSTNVIEYTLSDKELPEYPHKGGNIDAPFILFEDPPEPDSREICQLYCGGLDHYKHDTSSGDSLGAFYIVKRKTNAFESDKIVACYVSRPNTMERFNFNVELLMKLYGAEVLQENADISFQQYLMRKNEIDLWLMNGEKLAQKQINSRAYQNNKYGLTPNVKNIKYVFQLVVDYCWEIIDESEDEDGMKINTYGITRIKDLLLLDEIISYKKGQNHDRILAFGYALAWAQYLDDINVSPNRKKSNITEFEMERKRLMNKVKASSFYSNRRTGFY